MNPAVKSGTEVPHCKAGWKPVPRQTGGAACRRTGESPVPLESTGWKPTLFEWHGLPAHIFQTRAGSPCHFAGWKPALRRWRVI